MSRSRLRRASIFATGRGPRSSSFGFSTATLSRLEILPMRFFGPERASWIFEVFTLPAIVHQVGQSFEVFLSN